MNGEKARLVWGNQRINPYEKKQIAHAPQHGQGAGARAGRRRCRTACEMLPLWTRAAVRIPDHPVLVRELRLLERMPTRMGRDQVVHPGASS